MQLNTSISNRELPINRCSFSIPALLVCPNFSYKHFFIPNSTIKTLPLQYAQLYFCHIQPRPMLWRRMKLQLLGDAPSLGWLECLIKRGYLVRVEIIQHYSDQLGLWVSLIYQPFHLVSKVYLSPPLGDCYMTPASLRLAHHKQVARAVAFVFIVVALCSPRTSGQLLAFLFNQLLAGFIKVNFRALFVILFGVQIQNIFHASHKLGIDFWDTPLLLQPGLELVFFSARRTSSYEQESASFSCTTRSASNCKVQRCRPSGAFEQASAIRRACAFGSSLGFLPGRGSSLMASNPTSTNRLRTRSTVAIPTLRAATISSSVEPPDAFNRIRARVSLRDEVLPRRMSCCSCSRSSALKSTMYFFFGISGVYAIQRSIINFIVMNY